MRAQVNRLSCCAARSMALGIHPYSPARGSGVRASATGGVSPPAADGSCCTKPTICPLTIPLVCCHINSFRRASSCGEAIARGRKEARRAGIASRGMRRDWVVPLPYAATGVSLLAGWCLIGATPRGQPWTPAVTLPHVRDGLSAGRMTVLWTFRRPCMGRPVPHQLLRDEWLDVTTIVPETACHRRSYAERYSRFTYQRVKRLV
jgi:hypothetical protein